MTISYAATNPLRVLGHWKGSVWQAVWRELLVYLLIYSVISVVLRTALPLESYDECTRLINQFKKYAETIPLKFILGFYVDNVVTRWWNQIVAVEFPESLLTFLCGLVPGNDRKAVMRRRTIVRWLILQQALCYRDFSLPVRKRFPTLDHLVRAGLMNTGELELYKKLPFYWITRQIELQMAEHKNPTAGPSVLGNFFAILNSYRENMIQLYMYDWVNLPLVYTQIACLATYAFFGFLLIGHQFPLEEQLKSQDLYIPMLTVLLFVFYVGWFKVGMYLMRPFGEDDDDFDLNYIIDRNLRTALSFVDETYSNVPDVNPEADLFKQQGYPILAYTKASAAYLTSLPKMHLEVDLSPAQLQEAATPVNHRRHKTRHF